MQDVLDFVNWFKVLRSDDISVGITKIRQITFQKRSALDAPPQPPRGGPGVGGAAAQSGGEDDGGCMDDKSSNLAPLPGAACGADCFASIFLQQLLELPTKTRAAIDKLLQPDGMSLPSVNHTRQHFAQKYTNAARAAKKRSREDAELAEMQYRMTYKTSMYVLFVRVQLLHHADSFCFSCGCAGLLHKNFHKNATVNFFLRFQPLPHLFTPQSSLMTRSIICTPPAFLNGPSELTQMFDCICMDALTQVILAQHICCTRVLFEHEFKHM